MAALDAFPAIQATEDDIQIQPKLGAKQTPDQEARLILIVG